MADETALKFPERLNLQAPRGLGRALDELANRQHSTRSEVVRRALLRECEQHGVKINEATAPLEAA